MGEYIHGNCVCTWVDSGGNRLQPSMSQRVGIGCMPTPQRELPEILFLFIFNLLLLASRIFPPAPLLLVPDATLCPWGWAPKGIATKQKPMTEAKPPVLSLNMWMDADRNKLFLHQSWKRLCTECSKSESSRIERLTEIKLEQIALDLWFQPLLNILWKS